MIIKEGKTLEFIYNGKTYFRKIRTDICGDEFIIFNNKYYGLNYLFKTQKEE